MKTREFRLGNHTNGGIVFQISDDYIVCAGTYNISGITLFSSNKIEPAPLTEEWLIRLGFQKSKNDGFGGYLSPEFGDRSARIRILDNVWHNEYNKCEVKYVHQLQNLYFAITGEELTIK